MPEKKITTTVGNKPDDGKERVSVRYENGFIKWVFPEIAKRLVRKGIAKIVKIETKEVKEKIFVVEDDKKGIKTEKKTESKSTFGKKKNFI